MFTIGKDKKAVGHILIGNSSYGYPSFQVGKSAPPSIPHIDEVKASLEKDLMWEVDKEEISEPARLLYLGIDQFYAIYKIRGQMVGINLIAKHATLASELKSYMPSPQEYKDITKEIRESKPGQLSTEGDEHLPLSPYSGPGGPNGSYCGPCSGVSIGRYYREHGHPWLPNDAQMYWDLYDTMEADVFGGIVFPWNYGPGFAISYSEFWYEYKPVVTASYYWTVVAYIDCGWPFGLCGSPVIWHWKTIEGYHYEAGIYSVYTNDSLGYDDELLPWALIVAAQNSTTCIYEIL